MKNSTDTKLHIPGFVFWCIAIVGMTIAEILLLAAISQIPRSAIKANVEKSAHYFMQKDVFYNISDKDSASCIDHYADAILINIIYNYDSNAPFSSTLRSAYYHQDNQNENENLADAVSTDVNPTYDYSRYWHGSSVLIRPLLTILSIRQIYILFAILLIILSVIVIALLYIRNYKACMFSFIIALITVSPWYIPMSLEYIWCFLIMLISILCIIHIYSKHSRVPAIFFLMLGNITAYVDFLTTETLTLLAPVSILLVIMYENNKLTCFKDGIKVLLSDTLAWAVGYVSSWILKWTISSIVLNRNVFAQALHSASSRIYGNTNNLRGIKLSIYALFRNITCLIPFNYITKYSYIYAVLFFVVILMVYYLFRKSSKKSIMPGIFAIISCIPYLRYITLANHSYLHYFFTYRAQFASVFCLCIIFYYGIDKKLISKIIKSISGSRNPSR